MPAKKQPAKPRQAKPHNPVLLQWLQGEAQRERIKEILADEVFIAACRYLAEENGVRLTDIHQQQDLLIARKATLGYAYDSFPDKLNDIVQRSPVSNIPASWDHITSPNQ